MNSTSEKVLRATRRGRLVIPDVSGLTNRQAAHAYLDAGLMPHPWRVKDGTKVSCYSGFKFHEIWETHEGIDKWKPSWQCGLACSRSSGLIAADIDDRAEFRAWVEQQSGLDIPATAWARTGREEGGTHLLFDARDLAPEDWPTQGNMPGGQIKSNGFIAVEPSLHPNGRPYRWVTRELAPMGALATAVASYRLAALARVGGESDADEPEQLRQACLDAGDGEQRSSLLTYVLRLQYLGYAVADIVRLCESLRLQNYNPKRPWRPADFRGLIKQGEHYIATPEDREILASLPSLEKLRSRNSARRVRPFNFSVIADGTFLRAEAKYGFRADNVALFYPGKEHAIYGETESGKDMWIVSVVKGCLEDEQSVIWIDFEEGDGADIGSRLLNAGLARDLLCDTSWFQYFTPADKKEADAIHRAAVKAKPDLVILDGVTAAYGVYGWQVKENDAATAFRAELVRPFLAAGSATIATDHVTKEAAGNGKTRGRYALGGVMKLNMVSGAAYLIESVAPIMRGGEGASRIFLTKDRPGSVKPKCAAGKDPKILFAGVLTVKSSGDGPGELLIDVIPPQPEDSEVSDSDDVNIPAALMEKVSRIFEAALPAGRAPTTVRDQWRGKDKTRVMATIEVLQNGGYLAQGEKTTRGYRLRSARPWREGEDDKLRIRQPNR